MARTPEEILTDVVALVAGLQVPVSLSMPLGEAQEPWRRLKDDLQGFGWLDTDHTIYVEKLAALFECNREHDYSGEVPFET